LTLLAYLAIIPPMHESSSARYSQNPALDTMIIYNSHAGDKDRSREVEAAAKRLQGYGGRVEVSLTLAPGHATELTREAREQGYSQIMVAGGDGTFREAATAAVHSGLIIGLLPTGYEEIWRREAKIPKDLLRAVDLAVTGRVQLIDTGRINGILFVFDAGIGADAQVVHGVQQPGLVKDGKGLLRYLDEARRVLPKYRGLPASLTIDRETFDIDNFYQLWVNNSQNLARIKVREDARVDNGIFAITIVSGKKLSELLIPGAISFVRKKNTNKVVLTVGSNIQVDFSQKRLRKAQVDGDPVAASSQFDISLSPASLYVRVPNRENVIYSRLPISR